LLIVVAIILTVAAIVFPKLLRSRIAADEASAASSIRIINKAEVTYQVTYPTIGYASLLGALGPGASGAVCGTPDSRHACLIDSALSNATSLSQGVGGYWFLLTPTSKDTNGIVSGYVVSGVAAVYNETGVRDFCSVEDGVTHFRVPASQSTPVAFGTDCTSMPVLH
jgi:type II secretory pathway pseudopilin PulG